VLTDRERDVLGGLGDGLSNQQIARRLDIGEATVKTHVSRVLMKLGVQSRVQAAVIAAQSGLS
jgi:DNA-binding NarL/FixJ family response regulator